MRFQLLRIERDAHRQALDDFHPVARRILRWDQREGGAGAAGDADHLAAIDDVAAIIVRGQLDRLADADIAELARSEEHTSELQSLMSSSYAVFCLKQKKP